MTKRKRLITPFGAAEADSIELVNNSGFATHYGQPERDFAVLLGGKPVAVGLDTLKLCGDRLAALVPFGTPVEITTL